MRSAAVIVLVALTAALPVRGAQAPPGAVHLLDVPYLPQSEELCGGAAVAMVMRYWGAVGVYAETFAELQDRAVGGIRGEDLLKALRARGWQAVSVAGDRALALAQIDAGRPIIVLIEDRPGRFHYVVIVGWSGSRVVVHDPARAPFRVLDERAFQSAWQASGFWTLLASPPAGGASPVAEPGTPESAGSSPEPCGPLVNEGVRLAGTGDTDGAARTLQLAADACPHSAAPWREIAGVEALRSHWSAAAAAARRAIALDPDDRHAWKILATSLYLQKSDLAALDAWNHAGEPSIDLVKISGLQRTRYAVASRATGLGAGAVLTTGALRAAERRLSELPTAQAARVSYIPGENGRAQVDAVVIERPPLPTGSADLAAVGLHILTDRALAVKVASPTGAGELWAASWRWWQHRPMVSAGFSAPAPFGGIWNVELTGETQTYLSAAGARREENRLDAGVRVSNWTTRGLRWEVGGGIDRWRDAGRAARLSLSLEQRVDSDRGSLSARIGTWQGGVRTWTFAAAGEWRSATRHEGRVVLARAAVDLAGDSAPLALWPGAGTGQGRAALLRAHPLLDDGIVRGEGFGRRLLSAGGEVRQWSFRAFKIVRLAPALFVDAARASRGMDNSEGRWLLDAGAGLRVALPGAGVLRIDLAHGLRDGVTAFSVGWTK